MMNELLLDRLNQLKRIQGNNLLTVTFARETGQTAIQVAAHLSEQVTQAVEEAWQKLPDPQAGSLLKARWEQAIEAAPRDEAAKGWACFVSDSTAEVLPLPFAPQLCCKIASRFVVRPVLHLLYPQAQYLVIVLSKKKTRSYQGFNGSLLDVNLENLPRGLDAIPKTKGLISSGKSGEGGRNSNGLAESVADANERQRLKKYLAQVDEVAQAYAASHHLKTVIVGTNLFLPVYREVAQDLTHIMAFVNGSYDYASTDSVAEIVWPVVQEQLTLAHHSLGLELEVARARHEVVFGLAEAWQAVLEDRAEKLIVESGYAQPAMVEAGATKLSFDNLDASKPNYLANATDYLVELVRDAGGSVHFFPKGSLKAEHPLALITTY